MSSAVPPGFDSLKGISEDFCVFGDAAGMNPLNALLKYGRAVCGTVVVDVLQTVVTDQCSDGPARRRKFAAHRRSKQRCRRPDRRF